MNKIISEKKIILRLTIIKLLLLTIANLAFSQQFCITGYVYNTATDQPLEGANVVIRGTKIGAATDTSGEYQIIVPSLGNYEIEVSFVGFETVTKKIDISDEQEIMLNFRLKESIVSIEGIYVKSAREGITITGRMTIVDVEKFTEAARVYRLEEILARMAGIDIYRTGSVANPTQLVSMRGCNDLRFVIAVDGRAWSSPSHEDCPIDWSALTTDDIERIEIIRGGGTVLYDGAMGGIINIVRKSGTTEKGFTKPKITARIGLEALRTKKGSISVKGGIGSLGYFLSSGVDFSDGYLRNERMEGYDFSGNLHYNLPRVHGKISLSYKRHTSDMGYPVINDPLRTDYDANYPVVSEGGDLIRKWNDNVYPGGVSYRRRKMDFIDLIYEQPVKKATAILNLFANAGQDDDLAYCYRYTTFIDSITGDTTIVPMLKQLASISNEYTYGTSFRIEVKNVELHSFIFGADYRNLGTFAIKEDSIMGVEIEVPEGKDAIPDWFRLVGVFAEDQFKASSAINLTIGIRWSYLDEWTMPTYKNPATGDSGRVHFYYNALLPKLSASYSFSDSTIIYASVNRDWHVPNC